MLHAETIKRPGLFDHNDSPGPANRAAAAMNAAILDALDQAVPLHAAAMSRWSAARRTREARAAWHEVMTRMSGGAELMFGGRHAEDEFNALALVLAVFAYQPGGVTFATRHWCTDHARCQYAAFRAEQSEVAA